jgi:hypothetical protein
LIFLTLFVQKYIPGRQRRRGEAKPLYNARRWRDKLQRKTTKRETPWRRFAKAFRRTLHHVPGRGRNIILQLMHPRLGQMLSWCN